MVGGLEEDSDGLTSMQDCGCGGRESGYCLNDVEGVGVGAEQSVCSLCVRWGGV